MAESLCAWPFTGCPFLIVFLVLRSRPVRRADGVVRPAERKALDARHYMDLAGGWRDQFHAGIVSVLWDGR